MIPIRKKRKKLGGARKAARLSVGAQSAPFGEGAALRRLHFSRTGCIIIYKRK